MGIRGVFKYLQTHPECRENNSLAHAVKRVRRETGSRVAKLVCDCFGVLYWLLGLLHDQKVRCGDYSIYSYWYDGDINDYRERVVSFVRALRYIGVEPIFFVDGPRGADLAAFLAKKHTHIKRHRGTMHRIKEVSDILKYKTSKDMHGVKKIQVSQFLLLEVIMALRSEGVEVVECVEEADKDIIRYSEEHHSEVCGILSGDTDMVLSCKHDVFFTKFFDRTEQLGLNSPRASLNEKPEDIQCDKVIPDRLAQSLDISVSLLKDLSVIVGNDYTKGLNAKLEVHAKLGIGDPVVYNASVWLRHHMSSSPGFTTLYQDEALISHICGDSKTILEYRRAIAHTYRVYGEDVDIEEECHPARHTIVWRGCLVEVVESDDHCIQDCLLTVRKIKYKLTGKARVTEHGRTMGFDYSVISVSVRFPNQHLLVKICGTIDVKRILIFSKFLSNARSLADANLSHDQLPVLSTGLQLPQNQADSLFKPLLICACINFLHSFQDLPVIASTLTPETTSALLLSCITCNCGIAPRKVESRPSPNAINMGNWFKCIIEHAYSLAKLLELHLFLPLPSTVYQPSAYIPYHYVATIPRREIKSLLKTDRGAYLRVTCSIFDECTKLSSFKNLLRRIRSLGRVFNPEDAFKLMKEFKRTANDVEETVKQVLTVPQVRIKGKGPKHRKH